MSTEVRENCQTVAPEVFVDLSISHGPMVRADDADHGLRGLVDLATGIKYVVSEETLLKYQQQRASAID